jgi:hypothetical protein
MKQLEQLNKLEASLTPRQTVIVWLEEVSHCQDLFEFVTYLHNQSESARPLYRLPELVRLSLEQKMKGQSKEAIKKQVRRAVKDVAFLYYLHHHINFEVAESQGEWVLKLLLLCEWFKKCIVEQDPDKGHYFGLWRQILTELYAIRDAITYISQNYYDGHELLLPGLMKRLTSTINETEYIAEIYNDSIDPNRLTEKALSLCAVWNNARKETGRQIGMIVCKAKIEALTFMGDYQEVQRLCDQLMELDSQWFLN